MNHIAIRAEGISKQYHIGGPQRTYDRIGEQVVDMLMSPLRRTSKLLQGQATGAAELDETLWALKDVSFEVKRGEVVGIIGRNGAGKSTLLKILSRITDPTEGQATIYGRVGSLLEVGTGFHPELSGRENVYLNGSILGMRKTEIERKFHEIVDFAEIEKFIDTPVKHYSSGMYVRLAFAVAAHLEPEILIVDEVLAVGDVGFQQKCLGKMDNVANEGRTVIFVSHNMGIVQSLCPRGIFLCDGTVHSDGPVDEVVSNYLQTLEVSSNQDLTQRTERKGKGETKLLTVELLNDNEQSTTRIPTGSRARFVFHISKLLPQTKLLFGIYDQFGQPVVHFDSATLGARDVRKSGIGARFVCELDNLLLLPGRYYLNVNVAGDGALQDHVEGAIMFDVEQGHLEKRPILGKRRSSVYLPHRWIIPV